MADSKAIQQAIESQTDDHQPLPYPLCVVVNASTPKYEGLIPIGNDQGGLFVTDIARFVEIWGVTPAQFAEQYGTTVVEANTPQPFRQQGRLY